MKHLIKIRIILIFIVILSQSWGAFAGITQNKSTIINALESGASPVNDEIPGDPITLQPFIFRAVLLSSVFIAVFILGGLLMYLVLKRKILSILKEEKDTYYARVKNSEIFHSLKLVALIELLKIRKDKYKQEINQLRIENDAESRNSDKLTNEVRELKLKNQEFERQILELNRLVDDGSYTKPGIIPNIKKTEPSGKGFVSTYFTIPENDGSFSIDKGEYFANSKKFYKIEAAENSDYGKLYFLSGELDVKAINNIDFYLIPVCEVENLAISNSATRIIQEKNGTVVKIADKWVIDKKIKVKLI